MFVELKYGEIILLICFEMITIDASDKISSVIMNLLFQLFIGKFRFDIKLIHVSLDFLRSFIQKISTIRSVSDITNNLD